MFRFRNCFFFHKSVAKSKAFGGLIVNKRFMQLKRFFRHTIRIVTAPSDDLQHIQFLKKLITRLHTQATVICQKMEFVYEYGFAPSFTRESTPRTLQGVYSTWTRNAGTAADFKNFFPTSSKGWRPFQSGICGTVSPILVD